MSIKLEAAIGVRGEGGGQSARQRMMRYSRSRLGGLGYVQNRPAGEVQGEEGRPDVQELPVRPLVPSRG